MASPFSYRDAENGEIARAARERYGLGRKAETQLSPGLASSAHFPFSACTQSDWQQKLSKSFHFLISPNLAKCQEISTKEWATWQKSLSFNFYFHGSQRTSKSKTLIWDKKEGRRGKLGVGPERDAASRAQDSILSYATLTEPPTHTDTHPHMLTLFLTASSSIKILWDWQAPRSTAPSTYSLLHWRSQQFQY